ncbi:MAG: hypothetical protein IJZ85_13120 [Lachnospiraceae bacterium]|nr:hypothetical protein [Lachnospiraceae bacterium]
MSLFCIRRDLSAEWFLRRAAEASATTVDFDPNSSQCAQHSLQVFAPEAECCPDHSGREGTSLFTSAGKLRASLTVEAALAMSVFLFAVLALLSFFFVIRTEVQVQTALEQTGNQLVSLPEGASIASAALIFQEKLLVNRTDTSQIIGGKTGISLAQSSVMGHEPMIDLVAVYRMKLPFFPDAAAELTIVQRSRKRAFGEAAYLTDSSVKYVYITSQGEVYHEDMYCSYIKPKTEKIARSEVEDRRNADGSRYSACDFCGDEPTVSEVWITE